MDPREPGARRGRRLHARAWPLVEPGFIRQRQAALARHRQLAGTGKTVADAPEVVPAARDGRVDVLLLAAGARPCCASGCASE